MSQQDNISCIIGRSLQKHLRSLLFLLHHLPQPPSTCLRLHWQPPSSPPSPWAGAGQERHQAPEALPQLLHILLQAVDVRVQLPPAALHLRQHIVHQRLHLRWGWMSTVAGAGPYGEDKEEAPGNIRCHFVEVLTGCDVKCDSLASLTLQRSTSVFPWSARILFSIFTRRNLRTQLSSFRSYRRLVGVSKTFTI